MKILGSLWLLFTASVALAEDAKVTVFVFLKGSPLSQINITENNQIVGTTDSQGAAQMSLPDGIRTLVFKSKDDALYRHEINLRAGELVQLLVDFKVKGDQQPFVDVESSIAADAAVSLTKAVADDAIMVPFNGFIVDAEKQKPVVGA